MCVRACVRVRMCPAIDLVSRLYAQPRTCKPAHMHPHTHICARTYRYARTHVCTHAYTHHPQRRYCETSGSGYPNILFGMEKSFPGYTYAYAVSFQYQMYGATIGSATLYGKTDEFGYVRCKVASFHEAVEASVHREMACTDY